MQAITTNGEQGVATKAAAAPAQDGDEEEDYSLLNAFEMLWAPGCKESGAQNSAAATTLESSDQGVKTDEIDLVAD